MNSQNRRIAGLLVFVGGILGILGIIVAEALYPGYSTSDNYISDLGVGPSALVFNSSVFILGALVAASAYFIQKVFDSKIFFILVVLTGIGAMGVGLFTEDAGVLHFIFSLITFLFGGISAIASSKFEKPPLSYLSIVLGGMSLTALVLFGTNNFIGLGKGGMERLIAYPALLWAVGFGGHLIGDFEKSTAKESPQRS